MTDRKKQIISWRLKLILACGGVMGLALGAFSYHVARMDDSPNGTTPISWTFKAKRSNVSVFFGVERTAPANTDTELSPPAIDRVITEETEFALFALG